MNKFRVLVLDTKNIIAWNGYFNHRAKKIHPGQNIDVDWTELITYIACASFRCRRLTDCTDCNGYDLMCLAGRCSLVKKKTHGKNMWLYFIILLSKSLVVV